MWLRSRGAIPTVVALRQRFDAVRRSEVDRLTATLPADMREKVEDITRLVVEKLLLMPTEQLKSLSDVDTVGVYSEALTRLFGLAASQPTAGESAEEKPDAEAESPQRRRSDADNRRVEPFVRPQRR
jgi:glutamyl-tRNA reductase